MVSRFPCLLLAMLWLSATSLAAEEEKLDENGRPIRPNIGLILGVVIGGLIFLGTFGFVFIACCLQRHREKHPIDVNTGRRR